MCVTAETLLFHHSLWHNFIYAAVDSCAFSHLNTQSSPAYVPFIFDLTNCFQQLGDRHPVAFISGVFRNIQSIRAHEKVRIDGQTLRNEQKIVRLLALKYDGHSDAVMTNCVWSKNGHYQTPSENDHKTTSLKLPDIRLNASALDAVVLTGCWAPEENWSLSYWASVSV